MKKIIIFALVICFVGCVKINFATYEKQIDIKGNVVDEDNNPIGDARIKVSERAMNSADYTIDYTITNENGEFEFVLYPRQADAFYSCHLIIEKANYTTCEYMIDRKKQWQYFDIMLKKSE